MAIDGTKVTVTTAGVKLADGSGSDRAPGSSVLCIMEGTGPVYLDGDQAGAVANAGATSGKWDKAILSAITIALQPGEALWAATASGTCVVHVIKAGA